MATLPQQSTKNSPLQSKARSSEIGNTMRRSFSGNPFPKPSILTTQKHSFYPNTPVNTPSDYPRRHSFGRESVVVEDKENGRDQNLKPSKLRSPASSKGTKHFMSPTFSAASKVNASPRKKVLGERNDSILTSVSSFDGKNSLIEDCDSKFEKGSILKKEVSFDTTVTYLGENDAVQVDHEDFDAKTLESSAGNYSDISSSRTKHMDKDCVNLDPSFEISPRVPCSMPMSSLAPLDADPSMPPYDPKTNYLSPRPQFLHYRPNPRIELYLNQENEGKRLDESFSSESNSDTDVTEEESQSEKSLKEKEDGSSSDVAEEEKLEVAEQKELPVTETTSICAVEVKKASKQSFYTRTKFAVFLLLVASACLCISLNDSPIMEANVLNNLSLSEPYISPELLNFTRNTFNSIALKLQRSLYDSLSCIHDLVSSFRDRHKIGTVQYVNLTNLEDSLVNSGNNVFGLKRQANVVINELVGEHGKDEYSGVFEDESAEEVFEDESVEEVFEDDAIEEDIIAEINETLQSADDSIGETLDESSVQENGDADNLKTWEESKFSEPEERNIDSVEEVPDENMDRSLNPQAADVEDSHGEVEGSPGDVEDISVDVNVENPKLSESTEAAASDENSSKKSTLNITMFIVSVLAVAAATAFVYIRSQRHPTKHDSLKVDQTKTKECSPMPVWQTEVDMVGESCPSEMSSAYTKNGLTRTHEAQSQDKRRPRKKRESLVSSDYSTGSPSYGSFTTYENIPTKHGYGDEEVVTPVRRSSRIRNIVTSP